MTTILVSNISPSLAEQHLRELFECCGPIQTIWLKEKEPRLCVIAYFEPAHAQAASLLTGTPLGDRKLSVGVRHAPASSVIAELETLAAEEEKAMQQPISFPVILNGSLTAQSNQPVSAPLLLAAKKRQEEIARTIYVGNLSNSTDSEILRKFFSSVGNVVFVKIVGDSAAERGRFAFIEFTTLESAQTALSMSGSIIDGRPVKVGKSNNPIIKPGQTDVKTKNIDEIMAKVRSNIDDISHKVNSRERRSRSRSRSRGKRRHRDRDRDRGDRDRDRDRDSHKKKSRRGSRDRSRDRRDRSRDRSRDRRRKSRDRESRRSSRDRESRESREAREAREREAREAEEALEAEARSTVPRGDDDRKFQGSPLRNIPAWKKKDPVDRTGMFFDGYSWQPLAEVASKVPAALALSQSSTSIKK